MEDGKTQELQIVTIQQQEFVRNQEVLGGNSQRVWVSQSHEWFFTNELLDCGNAVTGCNYTLGEDGDNQRADSATSSLQKVSKRNDCI